MATRGRKEEQKSGRIGGWAEERGAGQRWLVKDSEAGFNH